MLATAESCTGGLVSCLVTDIAGSSAWFAGGVVSYTNAAKCRILGVPQAVLDTRGAVSRETVLAMGLLEEPRYILKNVCRQFYEMPENTIREQTFCCGGGAGLNNEEFTETRLRGGLPRGNAVKYVRDRHGVNNLACICAIDRATLPPLCDYWAPGVGVSGVHELVGNALILDGEKKRTTDLRQNPLPGMEAEEE